MELTRSANAPLSRKRGRGSVGDVRAWINNNPRSALHRRVVARIDRLRQKLFLVVGPELADVMVGLDGLVPELEAVLGAFLAELADVEVADHVAEVIELERAARRVG